MAAPSMRGVCQPSAPGDYSTHTAQEIDQEVRDRIKNLEEGTAAWEVEYNKVLEQVKGKHGIKE